MVVKTFRGQLADGGQDHIRLQTIKGKVGYRVVKFALFPNRPGTTSHVESVGLIFKNEQTTVPTANSTVDFTDTDLLAAAYLADDVNNTSGPLQIVIFDQEIFNQDIYLTHTDEAGTAKINYYLELEVIPLTDHGAEFTTLKDMRQS